MTRKPRKSAFVIGAISFFVLVAFVMQIAILVYDFIIQKTSNKTLIAILILIMIVILSVVITIFDIIRRKIMVDRPVKRIISATEKIASGDFSVRLEINHTYDKYNEFDEIMENLNIMASELSKTEILKKDFISNISHEIKTPLSIIQSYAMLLQDKDLSDTEREKHAKTLLKASRRLSSLVANILQLTKLENQALKLSPKKINLSDLVAELVIENEEVIEDKGLELECDIDEVEIISERSYIEIIISNLLSNAIKFTDSGKISVSVKKENDQAIIKISDTGIGISRADGEKIFDKFYQADTSRATIGNGLGLALVKRVIDILGGEISVVSELGKGSTFTVKLKDL
ncbi:MAG: HAMP domain-containing histidine kinase [Clostridia bacterium]|nr:HAMP domain-containing histidine kinase [Clostridia bacterium]